MPTINADHHLSKCWQSIDRRNFVPKNQQLKSHQDSPIPIGHNQTTSQPTLILDMLKHLEIKPPSKLNPRRKREKPIRALDIGSGSGIVTALLACALPPSATVTGIDIYPELVKAARRNIEKIPQAKRKSFATMQFEVGDAYKFFDLRQHARKYDLIYVGAEPKGKTNVDAFKQGIPRLLAKGGRAVAPIEGVIQTYVTSWVKVGPKIRFVPLQDTRSAAQKIGHARRRTRKHTRKHTRIHIKNRERGTRKRQHLKHPKQPKQPKQTEEEEIQQLMIAGEKRSRMSLNCDPTEAICNTPAITSRSYKLYRKHLFPDFKTRGELDRWCEGKTVVDVGSGINVLRGDSFIGRLRRRRQRHQKRTAVVGVDLLELPAAAAAAAGKLKRYAPHVSGDVKTLTWRAIEQAITAEHPSITSAARASQRVVLVNNVFYLWIDDPIELLTAYKNIFSWLRRGDQVRVFPVYFGRYDAYSPRLKRFIDGRCEVEVFEPQIMTEAMYEWDTAEKRVVRHDAKSRAEKKINEGLGAKTLVLTMRQ